MKNVPLYVSADVLKKFIRYEITFDEMTHGLAWENIIFEKYNTKVEDLRVAFQNMSKAKITLKTFIAEWYSPIIEKLAVKLGFEMCIERYIKQNLHKKKNLRFPLGEFLVFEKDLEVIYCIFDWLEYYIKSNKNYRDDELADVKILIKTIDTYYKNQEVELEKRKYTIPMSFSFVGNVKEPKRIVSASAFTKKLFIDHVNRLCKADVALGYKVKGYGCLTGTCGYRANKDKALELFLKLYEKTGDYLSAEIIGDIYYSGTKNIPVSYEQAFQYYSICAAAHNQTCQLKMSDMLCRGKGVIKNEDLARRLVWELFEYNYNEFCSRSYYCFLADVAIRIGMFYDDGIGCKADPMEAFKYYNIGRYAVKCRYDLYENPADETLYNDVCSRCDELAPIVGCNPNATSVFSEVPNMLLACMADDYSVLVSVEKEKGAYKITTSRVQKPREEEKLSVLIEYPLSNYCKLHDSVVEYIPENGSDIWILGEADSFIAQSMTYVQDSKECLFYNNGEVVASFKSSVYECKLD